MDFSLFLEISAGADAACTRRSVEEADLAGRLASIDGVTLALAYTPEHARDPFLAAEPAPALVLQIYFGRLRELEAAAGRDGPLGALVETLAAACGGMAVSWETVVTRRYGVPQPRSSDAVGPWCTYLVRYEGPADDANAWLDHYLAHNPPLMCQLPGLRELEICSPLDAVAFLPGHRRRQLQRNKVAFDSPQALDAALRSPVREQMRRDFTTFPAYTGAVSHHAMQTWRVVARAG